MRVFGLVIAALIATPFVLFLVVFVYVELAIVYTQWRFNRQEVNQKIAEHVPDWSRSSTWIDATLAFPITTPSDQLQKQMAAAGHDCQIAKNGTVAKLTCEAFAGYVTWDCSLYQYVTAEFGLEGTLSSVSIKRYRNCW